MPALSPFLWKLIGGAVALGLILSGLWWVQHTIRTLEAANATLKANYATVESIAQANAAALVEEHDAAAKAMTAVAASQQAAQVQSGKTETVIREVIHHVPVAPSEAIAPVLDSALGCLRQSGSCDGPANPSGQGTGSGTSAAAH